MAKYLYGNTRQGLFDLKSGVAVVKGDHLYRDASDSNKVKPAGSFTWGTAVATPSAPTVANGTAAIGTGMTNAATGVKVSLNFAWGEGALSAAGSATPTLNAGIQIAALDISGFTGALSRNIYVETAAASGIYKLWGTDNGGANLITGYGSQRVPPTAVTSSATDVTQYSFHLSYAGVADQSYDGTTAGLNTAGIKDGKIRVLQDGVFEENTAAATYAPGDLVGLAKQSGNLLEPQKVVACSGKSQAVGRVAEGLGTSATLVRIRISPPLATIQS